MRGRARGMALALFAGAAAPAAAQGGGIYGDVSGDGKVMAADALAILAHTVGRALPAGYTIDPNGDVNADAKIMASDALIVLSYTVGKDVSQYRVGQPLPTTPVSSIEIISDSRSVKNASTLQLTAVAKDAKGSPVANPSVTWKLERKHATTISSTGLVSGWVGSTELNYDTVTVSAAFGSSTAKTLVTVINRMEFNSISVAPDLPGGSGAMGLYPPGHSCGIASRGGGSLDRHIFCWGANTRGQLGIGSADTRPHPVPELVQLDLGRPDSDGSSAWVAVHAGVEYTCAIAARGQVYCWGVNSNGQLGNGTTVDSPLPSKVAATSKWEMYRKLSTGSLHACALDRYGAAYCWGAGAIGDGQDVKRTSPTAVAGDLVFHDVSAGMHHTCGVTKDFAAYCWGLNNPALGAGGRVDSGLSAVPLGKTPVRVVGEITAIKDTTYQWPIPTDFRKAVTRPLLFAQVIVGGSHACGIARPGEFLRSHLYCWGLNISGELGFPKFTSDRIWVFYDDPNTRKVEVGYSEGHFPQRVDNGVVGIPGDPAFEKNIELGWGYTCAIAEVDNGSVNLRCWGKRFLESGPAKWGTWPRQDKCGKLGNLECQYRPVTVWHNRASPLRTSIGHQHACVMPIGQNPSPSVLCWGSNEYGQLGDGTTTDADSRSPRVVGGR